MPTARTGSRGLVASLWFGAFYDWCLAAAILFATPEFMEAIRFPPPADPFLFRLAALPPLLFPVVYVAAARDPAGRPWAVRASVQFRIVGGVLLAGLAWIHHPPGYAVYMKAALFDIVLGVAHAVLSKKNPLAQGDANG